MHCGSDLDYNEETVAQWNTKVLHKLDSTGFEIRSARTRYTEVANGFCGNCARTGDYMDILVLEDQRADLLELGFRE